ncbi:uncharacterized protein LOC120355804 isoform X2 [Nilaparvata lugens]|uniref:uncharacterized protein LOC120355749 isoform X2 n=1 Tax=Nilaparvata lugens TaxID=108931 RepID=UPI00193EA7CF|nr:uncharacterized protein LOC120355749 isoform X2 [Nilaparvata lugens]XP_039300348.1 uncharacterized protein LOC120355749 isoform X2 [Nilaparvata lugens]XP_039300445.1 uncharacterized protein LOC120355804 isoform X2 [Nilaparvata lugens]
MLNLDAHRKGSQPDSRRRRTTITRRHPHLVVVDLHARSMRTTTGCGCWMSWATSAAPVPTARPGVANHIRLLAVGFRASALSSPPHHDHSAASTSSGGGSTCKEHAHYHWMWMLDELGNLGRSSTNCPTRCC